MRNSGNLKSISIDGRVFDVVGDVVEDTEFGIIFASRAEYEEYRRANVESEMGEEDES